MCLCSSTALEGALPTVGMTLAQGLEAGSGGSRPKIRGLLGGGGLRGDPQSWPRYLLGSASVEARSREGLPQPEFCWAIPP